MQKLLLNPIFWGDVDGAIAILGPVRIAVNRYQAQDSRAADIITIASDMAHEVTEWVNHPKHAMPGFISVDELQECLDARFMSMTEDHPEYAIASALQATKPIDDDNSTLVSSVKEIYVCASPFRLIERCASPVPVGQTHKHIKPLRGASESVAAIKASTQDTKNLFKIPGFFSSRYDTNLQVYHDGYCCACAAASGARKVLCGA